MKLKAIATASVLVLVTSVAQAVPLRYEYSGVCTLNCSAIGVSAGSAVTGFMLAEDGFADGGILEGSELIDFEFDFGNVAIRRATHGVLGFLGLNPGLSIDYSIAFSGLTFQSFGTGATTGNIGGAAGWTARNWFSVAGGEGSYTAVPEPGTLALLGLGLFGLGMVRRKPR